MHSILTSSGLVARECVESMGESLSRAEVCKVRYSRGTPHRAACKGKKTK